METHTQKFKIRLGLFIAGGIIPFCNCNIYYWETEKFI